ncbi:MAG: DUF2269 family protein [Dehalobacterium sp.]
MKKIGIRTRGWIKGFHILFSALWVGAAFCMMLLAFVKGHITNGDELWVINKSIKLIDDFIIIPSALGCLITGIMFSTLTNWGFFKHNWITIKYIITFTTILFGTFFLGHWVNGMEAISASDRLLSLQNPSYVHYAEMNKYFGTLQAVILAVTLFISVLKPWGKRVDKKKQHH